jgi:hypothetical protein
MESGKERSHQVKRVVLPSGKTIEVVYFEEASAAVPQAPVAEEDHALHVCLDCGSQLVHPVEWAEAGPKNWTVVLRCPNCGVFREGVFSQETVDAFDEELDQATDALARDYKRLMRANMAEDLERFASALQADAILPEDF